MSIHLPHTYIIEIRLQEFEGSIFYLYEHILWAAKGVDSTYWEWTRNLTAKKSK